MSPLRTTNQAQHLPSVDAIEVRRLNLGISLLDCASQLGATVTARAYDKIRRVAGALRGVADELAEHYGFSFDEVQIAVTPLSLIAHSLSEHELASVASAIDAAARDTGVDAVYGCSSIGPIGAQRGATTLANALPSIIASTERVHASLDCTTPAGGIHTPAAIAYSRVVREIGDLSLSTPAHFLRIAAAPYCPDTLLFHDARKPDVVASVELSCLNEILTRVEALSDDWDLTRIASDVQQIASRQYRAARFVADRFAEAMTQRSGTNVWGGRALVTTTPVGLPEKRDLSSAALEQLRRRSPSRAWTSVVAAAVDRGALAARIAIRNSPMDTVEVGAGGIDTVPATAELGTAHRLLLLRSEATAEEIANAFVEHVLSRPSPREPISIMLAEAGVDDKLDLPASARDSLSNRASDSISGPDRQTVH